MTLREMSVAGLMLALLWGCGGGGDGGADTGPADAGSDSMLPDTGPRDTGATDTGPADTGPADTGPAGCTTGCEIEQVVGGLLHSCARRANGEVLCWGTNEEGELGDTRMRHAGGDCTPAGSTEPRDCTATPVKVALPGPAVDITTQGGRSACARLGDGKVYCWGNEGAPPPGSDVLERRYRPEEMAPWAGATDVSDSRSHTCAVLADGTTSCVWRNEVGQLGDGTNTDRLTPVAVATEETFAEVVTATWPGRFTCGRTTEGAVLCWGINRNGELGTGADTHQTCGDTVSPYDCTPTPVVVTDLGTTDGSPAVVQLALGTSHVCALHEGGTVSCWGNNDAGQLGLAAGGQRSSPVAIEGLTGVTKLAAGSSHTCALFDDGSVQCWGANDDGELGDGSLDHGMTCARGASLVDCTSTPVDVALPAGSTVVDLAIGNSHTCAALSTGAVYCWGWNDGAQLGNTDRVARETPVAIAGLD